MRLTIIVSISMFALAAAGCGDGDLSGGPDAGIADAASAADTGGGNADQGGGGNADQGGGGNADQGGGGNADQGGGNVDQGGGNVDQGGGNADQGGGNVDQGGGNADSHVDSAPPSGKLAYEEKNGRVVVEAEHYFENDANGKPRQWYVWKAGKSGIKPDPDPEHTKDASGGSYLEGLPDTRVTANDTLTSGVNFFGSGGQGPIVRYRVWFNKTGRYYVRVRAYSTGAEDNGIHVGLDGKWPASGERMQWCSGKNQWTWSGAQRTAANHCGEKDKIYIDINSAGLHVIQFSMREDGFELDRFVLTADKAYNPSGAGPAESTTRAAP